MFEYSRIPQISDSRKCRLCFENQTSLMHIFETTGTLNEVARTISEMLNFEVSAEDHFPPFVCSYCYAKLFDFRAFKTKCYSLRETYKLILQRKAECVRKVDGGMPVAENMESKVFLERNVAEPNHEEVSLHNVSPLPMKVEDAAVGDGNGVPEQIETEQKESTFNVSECPIKTELVGDKDEMLEEAEMSEEAENDQTPERHDNSPQSRKQVWFQINPAESEMHVSSEQRDAENVPESSSYHLDGYPISNRKLGAEGEVIYSRTCSSVSGMDFPVVAADVTIPEMDDKSSGHSEAYGYHAGSYKPQMKDVIRENPPNWEEEVLGRWQIDDSREEESNGGENRNVSPTDDGNSGVATEMENDMEYVRCHHCGESKLTKDELKRHIYSAHPTLFREVVVREINGKQVRRQRCTLCLKDFKSRAHLVVHFMIHTGEKPFVCSFCSYSTNSNSYLTVHLRKHTGERPFKCTVCNFATVTGVILKEHMRTHTRGPSNNGNAEDSLTCKVCRFIGPPDIGLKHHTCRLKAYKCEQCSYSCVKKKTLRLHMRIHTGDKLFKCEHCSYFTVYSSNIKVHMRLHTGEKPHKCHICDFGASSNAALNVHVMKHTGEKPLECELCEYSTAVRSCLKKHVMSKHTGEKPYKCHLCDFRSTSSASLKAHIHKHTGERPYKCPHCKYSTRRRWNFNVHVRRHEKKGEIPAVKVDKL